MRIALIQTCLPDYRLKLFQLLNERFGNFELWCGSKTFSRTLKLNTAVYSWRLHVKNVFLFDSLLFQSGIVRRSDLVDVLILEFNPRIISSWLILLRRSILKKRTILWGHLWGQAKPQFLMRVLRLLMLKLSDGFICYTRSQMYELKVNVSNYPVWAASNSCLNREECSATEAPVVAPCVIYVGRMIAAKKVNVLLEGFARALPRLPHDAKLLLVGDGDLLPSLRERVAELGLQKRVEMPGHVNDTELLRLYYTRSMIAVSPGYVGLSAIQAMAHGVPMLVSKDEPHSPEIEACLENQTAAFFKTDDLKDLADKMVDFMRPDSPWPVRREAISAYIAQNYTFEGMVDTFTDAINTFTKREDNVAVPSQEGNGPVAVVWAQYGPYHLARLRALRELMGSRPVMGVEISSQTATYGWSREIRDDDNLWTLLSGQNAEKASALAIYWAALRLFRRERVETVFVPSYWPPSSFAVLLAAETAGARVIMMNDSHELTAKASGIWLHLKKTIVRRFDAALVAGTPQKEYFTKMGLASELIVTGYDVVDNQHFAERARRVRVAGESEKTRKELGLPQRYFLNVGRMVEKKNLETLVAAYQLVHRRLGSNCPKLVFVGAGKLERNLREQCFALNLTVCRVSADREASDPAAADVYFYGFKQADILPAFYGLADCFVLPSREEEWGLVVNEAMACGVPVLVSRVAGCAQDLVQEGRNGYTFEPFDSAALARLLERVAGDQELRARLGAESEVIIAEWSCARFAAAARRSIALAEGGALSRVAPEINTPAAIS